MRRVELTHRKSNAGRAVCMCCVMRICMCIDRMPVDRRRRGHRADDDAEPRFGQPAPSLVDEHRAVHEPFLEHRARCRTRAGSRLHLAAHRDERPFPAVRERVEAKGDVQLCPTAARRTARPSAAASRGSSFRQRRCAPLGNAAGMSDTTCATSRGAPSARLVHSHGAVRRDAEPHALAAHLRLGRLGRRAAHARRSS